MCSTRFATVVSWYAVASGVVVGAALKASRPGGGGAWRSAAGCWTLARVGVVPVSRWDGRPRRGLWCCPGLVGLRVWLVGRWAVWPVDAPPARAFAGPHLAVRGHGVADRYRPQRHRDLLGQRGLDRPGRSCRR